MSKGKAAGNSPELVSSLDALDGATVEALCTMRTEVARQVDRYLLLRVRKGKRIRRLILLAAEVRLPCPDDRAMLDDLLEGTGFFTLREIRERREGKPLLRENGKKTNFSRTQTSTIGMDDTKSEAIGQGGPDDHGGVGAGNGQPEGAA